MLGIRAMPLGALALAFSTTACHVTGGGQLIGEDGTRIANFGFSGDTCFKDTSKTVGHFNYVDQNTGVKMNGDIMLVKPCTGEILCCEGFPGVGGSLVELDFDYRSTNPSHPGEGQGFACVQDNGQGAGAVSDQFWVVTETGPFGGYSRFGTAQGNLQTRTDCRYAPSPP